MTTDTVEVVEEAREDAWNRLGSRLGQPNLSALEALQATDLAAWNLRKREMYTTENGRQIPIPGRAAVLRDDPTASGVVDVLGDVGANYEIVNNEEYCALLDTIVGESGAVFETAGSWEGGRKVFITMKLPDPVLVGGVDRVDPYLAVVGSHDGSMSLNIMATPVRVDCQNVLNLAFRRRSHLWRIRHTSGARKIIEDEALRSLHLAGAYLKDFRVEAERLINTTVTQQRFEALIHEEFGPPFDAPRPTISRTETKLAQMAELFSDAWTQEGIRDTAWAGLNALTEWFDHFSPTRGDDRDTARAVKAIMDPSFKNRALNLMLRA